MADVTVYTTDACPYCVRVKRLLDKREVPYSEINLGRDDGGRDELVARTGMFTFPQVLIDGELVGGYDETAAADRSGRLQQLLGARA